MCVLRNMLCHLELAFRGNAKALLQRMVYAREILSVFPDNAVNHPKGKQIRSGQLERLCRLQRFLGVFPENAGAALGGNDGINGIFHHPDFTPAFPRSRIVVGGQRQYIAFLLFHTAGYNEVYQ